MQTAEQVAKRYGVSKERMDRFGAESQGKACAAQEKRLFDAEIAPITVTAGVADAVLGLRSKQVTVSADEGLRPGTTYESIKDIRTAVPGGVVTAGNASQFSDGAGACVVVSEAYAERHGLKPLGRFLGFAVAGCEPDEMGIGPVFAVPKALARLGLTPDDIDLWELNELSRCRCCTAPTASASPTSDSTSTAAHRHRTPLRHERPAADRPCADRGPPPRRQARVRHMCIGGGMGAAGVFEVL